MKDNNKITKVVQVILKVRDVDRSVDFYENVIGLKTRKQEKDQAYLSADGRKDLIILKQLKNPKPTPRNSTGLFHIAILLPSKADLADQWLHLKQHSQWLEGASDHSVSEAIYLSDPDGNGIEIYADKEGVPAKDMGTERLHIEKLLEHATDTPWLGMPKETVIGHIHLKVKDLDEAIAFYRDVLGFQLMMKMGSRAAFMSTGGYHHHIGLNTWESLGGPVPHDDTLGLDTAVITVPDEDTLKTIKQRLEIAAEKEISRNEPLLLKDPSGNPLEIKVKA